MRNCFNCSKVNDKNCNAKNLKFVAWNENDTQQEERALELRSLIGRSHHANASNHHSNHHNTNPYQTDEANHNGTLLQVLGGLLCGAPSRRRPLRVLDLLHAAILFLVVVHFWNFTFTAQPNHMAYYYDEGGRPQPQQYQQQQQHNNNYNPVVQQEEHIQPWESTPPTPMSLMDTTNRFVRQRHVCLVALRARQLKLF
jgi:hypothetical protein